MRDDAIVRAMDGAGLRLTDQRRAVAAAIGQQEGHFSAEDVLATSRARRYRVGRATIFRSLDLLTDLGLVERVDLPSGEHAYVACEPTPHHHHVVCSHCGRAIEVDELGLEPVIGRVEAATGFAIQSHRLEMFGVCPDCQATAAQPTTAQPKA